MSVPVREAVAPPDADACRAQLRRILASPDFDATERDRRFLGYVVEEALAGRAERIKAYTIAVEVFGRDPAFDPQNDPIVRVEAGHMRRALDRYYLAAGRDDPIVIAVPKGRYAPTFEPRRGPSADEDDAPGTDRDVSAPHIARRLIAPVVLLALLAGAILGFGAGSLLYRGSVQAAAPDIPRLAVEPFEALDVSATTAAAAAGLTSEVIAELARFKDLVVVVSPLKTANSSRPSPPRYRLGGGVAMDGTDLRVQVRLQRTTDGEVIWADSFVRDLSQGRLLSVQSGIAGDVAAAVGQPYGAVFRADAAARLAAPSIPGDAYACTLAYFGFRARLDAPSYAAVRSCLDDAVERYPDYATAWALRSEIRIDGRRFGFAPEETLDQALAEARQALVLDPLNVRAMQAKMMALYLSGDMEGGLRVGERALAINPNDTELKSEYGFRLALSGRWDEGCPLMTEARAASPDSFTYFESGLALCAYMAGDYEEAAAWIRSTAVPSLPAYRMIAAAVLAETGRMDEARAESDWLIANAPEFVASLRSTIGPRVGHPEDFERFVGSLRKAGLPVPD